MFEALGSKKIEREKNEMVGWDMLEKNDTWGNNKMFRALNIYMFLSWCCLFDPCQREHASFI
jgi:hypothetical protein